MNKLDNKENKVKKSRKQLKGHGSFYASPLLVAYRFFYLCHSY